MCKSWNISCAMYHYNLGLRRNYSIIFSRYIQYHYFHAVHDWYLWWKVSKPYLSQTKLRAIRGALQYIWRDGVNDRYPCLYDFFSLDVLCKVNIVDNVINFIFSFDKFQLFVFWYVGYFIPFICLTFYSGIQ